MGAGTEEIGSRSSVLLVVDLGVDLGKTGLQFQGLQQHVDVGDGKELA